MTSILILLALGSLSGFVIGISHFSWPAILAAGAVLALLSAVVLQNQGFDAFPGISVIAACLAINQAAYVIAIRLKNGPKEGDTEDHLPQQGLDDVPRDDRNDDIHHEHKRHQNDHFDFAQFADPRQADLARRFSWPAILSAGAMLAPLSAVVLQNQTRRLHAC